MLNLTNKEFKNKLIHTFWHCSCNDDFFFFFFFLPFNHIVDEDEYLLELYRFFDNVTLEEKERHINRFKNLTFDPNIFKTDLNESFCNNQSSYYTEELLNQYQTNSKNTMSMLNANIRSLNKNVDSFKDFINTSTMQFGIIGLVETWLKDKPLDYFNLSGYNLEFQNRIKKRGMRGGGVCLYIKDDIKYTLRNDLQQIKHPDNVESIFIEIERP